jgi:hypothetical protein
MGALSGYWQVIQPKIHANVFLWDTLLAFTPNAPFVMVSVVRVSASHHNSDTGNHFVVL